MPQQRSELVRHLADGRGSSRGDVHGTTHTAVQQSGESRSCVSHMDKIALLTPMGAKRRLPISQGSNDCRNEGRPLIVCAIWEEHAPPREPDPNRITVCGKKLKGRLLGHTIEVARLSRCVVLVDRPTTQYGVVPAIFS